MEPALAAMPLEDWAAPPRPGRAAPPACSCPGEECAYRVVSGRLPAGGAPTTTVAGAPAETNPPTIDPATGEPVPGGPVETTPATLAPVVIQLYAATTIPPEVLDPLAPLPTIDTRATVLPCASLPGGAVKTSSTIPLPTAAP